MKFAILGSRGFPSTYGGYETLVRHLAPHLRRAGHEVTVYCRGREDRRRSWNAEGIRCVATPGYDTKSLSTLSYGMTGTVDACFRSFDSILVLNIANGFWFPLLRLAKTPFAVNTDGIEWERGKWSRTGRAVFKAGARLTARNADSLVCDSREIGRIWRDRFQRDSTFIPYGAHISEGAPSRDLDTTGLPVDEPFLLVVARLAPENNVDLILDALTALGSAAPRAIVVGSANFASPIEDRLRRMQAEDRLSWLGHVEDQTMLTELWRRCTVYVHGHSVGGTNPALLQALGAGAPTLALDTAFNAEVLPSADQLFQHDTTDLAQHIASVIASPDKRRDMAENGRAVIRERYSWDDVCNAYMATLEGLAERRLLAK